MPSPDGKKLSGESSDLRKEVERFRRWANAQPDHGLFGEWEVEYKSWPILWRAAETALETMPDAETIELLLYALARDHECESIAGMLTHRPEAGLEIARAAIAYPDPDARWQIAVFLGRQRSPESVRLLQLLVTDSHEYVRRRALLAIAPLDAAYAEKTAYRWLDEPEEYSRLAALIVLDEVDSQLLPEALERMRSDTVGFIRERAEAIEARRRPA